LECRDGIVSQSVAESSARGPAARGAATRAATAEAGGDAVEQGALKLQAAGLIRYARGHIIVMDREGLERRTCECYAVVKKEYDRLLLH
jgi:hypothetical protein